MFIIFRVGCIECGMNSTSIGICSNYDEAIKICDNLNAQYDYTSGTRQWFFTIIKVNELPTITVDNADELNDKLPYFDE